VTEFEAAENEAAGVGPSMEVGGKTVQFPAKLPPGIAAAAQMERADIMYKILAGGDDELLEHLLIYLQEEDFDRIAQLYGVSMGESDASAGS
jgi:hypothetical protein